ncbi:MAG: aldo/keto reductase, partial [Anaerolineaceae bacterium]|nr:aldo/keto reductase [Anaerolineaceae bacterium]
MEYRYLGSTGLKVSALCMGTMQLGWYVAEPDAYGLLDAACAAGINFIDTANVYSRWVEGNPGGVAEEIVGRWIKRSGLPRHRLVVATKVRAVIGDGPNDQGLSRVHIIRAAEDSLRRLQTEYIDLYQSHWYDENTPIEETMAAFDTLVQQGKVRYVGASNHPAWRMMQALWASDRRNLARYVSYQPSYSIVRREGFEREMEEVCQAYGLGVLPYSPLEGGFLTGKYRRDANNVDSPRAEGARRYFTERNWA